MAYLVLVRHGESEWNAKGLWTGLTDISLSEKGRAEAQTAAQEIKDITLHVAFTSQLKRAQQTLDEIKKILQCGDIPTYASTALNERDYGDLTGKNKWKIKEEFGEEQFTKWRRSFDERPPKGESLHDVYKRVIPYYTQNILPEIEAEKNTIIAAHGNSLRSLVKYLETISDEDIAKLEIATGEVYVYTINPQGNITAKEIRKPQ